MRLFQLVNFLINIFCLVLAIINWFFREIVKTFQRKSLHHKCHSKMVFFSCENVSFDFYFHIFHKSHITKELILQPFGFLVSISAKRNVVITLYHSLWLASSWTIHKLYQNLWTYFKTFFGHLLVVRREWFSFFSELFSCFITKIALKDFSLVWIFRCDFKTGTFTTNVNLDFFSRENLF